MLIAECVQQEVSYRLTAYEVSQTKKSTRFSIAVTKINEQKKLKQVKKKYYFEKHKQEDGIRTEANECRCPALEKKPRPFVPERLLEDL